MNTKALPQAPFYSPAHLATYPRIGVPPNSESLLQARVLYHHNSSAVPPRESPFFSPNNMSAPASTEHFLPFRSPWNIDPLSSYPYASGFGNLDVRRKNATRESTSTLKAWLYEHIKNPYPTKGEKIMLAIITKMTLTQVSTWFANARRRLKKENKMQWSPRNRTGEDDDEDDDDDDGAERKCESADGFDACKMDEKDENEDEENIVVDAGTEDLPAPDVVPVSSAAKVNNERKLYLEMKNNKQSSTKENIRDDKEIWNNHNSTSKVSDNPKNISKSIFKSEKSSPTDSTKISEYFPAPSFPFHLHQHFPIHPLHYSHFIHAKHKQNCADKILFTDTHKDQNSDFLLPSNYPFKSNHLTPNSLRNNFRENNKSIKCKEFFYGAFNRAMDQRKRSPSKLLRHNEDSNDSTTAKVKTEIMNNDEDQNICMDHNDYDNQNELDQKNSDTSENDFDKKLHFSSYRSSPHICNDTSSMKRKNDEKTPEMNKKTKIWSLVDVATKDKKSGKENNCKKNLRLSFIKNAIEANDQMTHEKSVHDSKESHENSTERKHSENKSNGLCAKNLETGEREKEEIMRLWNQQSLHHRTYTLPNNKAFQPWNHYQNYHFLVHQRHHKQHYHQQLYHKNNRPLLLIPQRHHTSTTDEFLQKFSKSSQSSPKNTPDLSKHIPIEKPEEKSTSFEFCLKKTDSSSPTSLTNHSQHLSNSDSSNIHSFKAKQPSTLHVLPSSSSTSSTASLLSASSHKASQSKSTTSHLNKTYPKIDPIKVKATSSPKTPTSASDAKPLHTKHHPQNGHKMVVSCRKQSSDSTFEYWADNGDSQTVFKSKTSRQL